MTEAPRAPRRVLLHLEPGRRVPVEPDEVFLLEADGDETRVRTRGRQRLRDIRSLGEVLARFPPASSSRCTGRSPSTSIGWRRSACE